MSTENMHMLNGILKNNLLPLSLLLCSYAFLPPKISLRDHNPAKPVPQARAHHSGVYDPSQNGFVVFGGFIFKDNWPQMTGDVWRWDGNNWEQKANTITSKIIAPMAFDEQRQRLHMFGGADTSGNEDRKLSVFAQHAWRVLLDAPIVARGDAGLVYDKQRDRLVLFGGVHQDKFLGDTWEFDGKNWNGKSWKQMLAEGPGQRVWPCFTYDSWMHRSVLFGGEDMHDHFYKDTWLWDGKTWKRIVATGPPGRIQFVMDYDRRRNRVVLFGGFGMPSHYCKDTWEFDGRAWIEKNK